MIFKMRISAAGFPSLFLVSGFSPTGVGNYGMCGEVKLSAIENCLQYLFNPFDDVVDSLEYVDHACGIVVWC